MPRSLEPQVLEAFRAETRRVIAGRGAFGIALFLGLVATAGVLEVAYHPERVRPLVWSLVLEAGLCVIGLAARRIPRLERYIIGIVTCMTIGIAFCITGYMVIVGGSGDALAFALIVYLTGVPLIYPWGAAGQVPFACCVFAGYLAALVLGVRVELPMPYGIISVAGAAASSIVGAILLDLHRRAIFSQRLLLARTRDQQMAVLYDVTRSVAATLELQEVLWLVCERVLDVLAVDQLWLLWREAPDREIRGLKARRFGERVAVADFEGGAPQLQALFDAAANTTPVVLAATADHKAAFGDDVADQLLRVPLSVQSELVGMIVAAGGVERFASEPSLLDFAATLANGTAMAIANARLHAIVLAHRAELQRLSNKRIDVVEEAMQRVSRELHDGICQALMAIKLDLTLLLEAMPELLRGMVRDTRAQVVDVVQGVRQMSQLLHPPALDDFGLIAAIESVAEKYRRASDLQIRVTAPDPTIRCAAAIELMLFRTFQEALINVEKHAGGARRMTVRVALDEDAVVLEISDDGKGFDAQAYFRKPPASAGLGLLGMRERVAHFGGVFRVTSRAGAGTRIYVSVPIEPIATEPVAAAL